jgi:hypothetical protein
MTLWSSIVRASAVTALILAVMGLAAPASARATHCVRWIDPEGDDGWVGSSSKPWATIEHAASVLPDEGCTVWIRPGIYSGSNQVTRAFTHRTTFRGVDPYQAVLGGVRAPLDIGAGASHITFQGLRFREWASGAGVLVYISGRDDGFPAPSHILLRDNVIHDSYGDDLLKIRSGAHDIAVRGNVFYNQADSEQHIDVNSVTDVTISDNIFFNDFESSGRVDRRLTKHYIVVKDSNGGADGLRGSRRVTIERNIFLRWQGGEESFVSIGNDGKRYLEARNVDIVNNLMLGDGTDWIGSALRVLGAGQVTFVNNTISGDLPSTDYAFFVGSKGLNPPNQDVTLVNNIWSDPTGTMSEFSDGLPEDTRNLVFTRNLYWNGGNTIPAGDLLTPLHDDEKAVVADPGLREANKALELPVWSGGAFRSGSRTIREEFIRLVRRFGAIPDGSRAIGRALETFAPARDILGRSRGADPDLGAYEGG